MAWCPRRSAHALGVAHWDRQAAIPVHLGAGGTRPSASGRCVRPTQAAWTCIPRRARADSAVIEKECRVIDPTVGSELVQRRDAQPVRPVRIHAVLKEQLRHLARARDRDCLRKVGSIAKQKAHERLVTRGYRQGSGSSASAGSAARSGSAEAVSP